jgi:hypothetical protein
MGSAKRTKVIILTLSIAFLLTIGVLGWTLLQNYWWRQSVDLVADEAGTSWAMRSFRRGHLALWEISPTNDFPRFSGRREGPYEIWLDEYHPNMPAPWQYTERRKIQAHNRQMRYMYEHPERFTPGKDEKAEPKSSNAEK